MEALLRRVSRLIAIADDPGDDDDLRLRKRVGVAAGYLTILAPLSLPIQAIGHPFSYPLAASLSLFSVANLTILRASGRFDRYVVALIAAGTVWVPLAQFVGGGITGSSPALVWAFLIPAYAILALGPQRALPWFVAFLLSVAAMAIGDPWARDAFGPAPYLFRVMGWVMNVVLPLTIVFVLLRYTDLRRRAAEGRADELLTNAIPASIARRLKHGEQRIAEAYPETTVLFADIVGFTPWARRTDPDRVTGLLDDLFTRFDQAASECGLEKIKTIGDAYMAVAGAPVARTDHAEAAVEMAQRLLAAAEAWRTDHGVGLDVRIGLASGPTVGGVIGQQRIQFDLWGDTVNTASRMEAHGVAGRIHLSAASRELLEGRFDFVPRSIEVKGLGEMTTYFLGETLPTA
ncbi:MAG: adenylate/guanylate cyclase domain-containing protein [Chloroflexota bacterium]